MLTTQTISVMARNRRLSRGMNSEGAVEKVKGRHRFTSGLGLTILFDVRREVRRRLEPEDKNVTTVGILDERVTAALRAAEWGARGRSHLSERGVYVATALRAVGSGRTSGREVSTATLML